MDKKTIEQRFLSINEAAQYFGTTSQALRMRLHRGSSLRRCLVKFDYRIYFDKAELEKWIEEHRLNYEF